MAPHKLTPVLSIGRQWPLALHIVVDQLDTDPQASSDQTGLFVSRIYDRLSAGNRTTRIPVRVWRAERHGAKDLLPNRIPLRDSLRNVVVVVLDQGLFERRIRWRAYFNNLAGEIRQGKDIILPVAIRPDAGRIADRFRDVNHFLISDPASFAEDERLFQSCCTTLLRLLVGDLPDVFLCHAKAGGEEIASKIRTYLYEKTQLSCFYDMHDIPHGNPVEQSIKEAIAHSAMLVVWTDKLLESPWCQYEIIEARRQQRPMLILDALSRGASRIFPFIGNMPVLRWGDNPDAVVSELLLELLRAHHLRAVFETLSGRKTAPPFGLHPPDLLQNSLDETSSTDVRNTRTGSRSPRQLFIYPDPPLKFTELDTLQRVAPHKTFLSLIEWQALRAAKSLRHDWSLRIRIRPNPMLGLRVGMSVSESDNWSKIGLIKEHQDELSADVALELILLGAKVLWGGDLRPEGFGSRLDWIVKTYRPASSLPQDHVGLFVPFSPYSTTPLSEQDLRKREAFADVTLSSRPTKLAPGEISALEADTPRGRALSAFALSSMRADMAKTSDARIVLGGRLSGFKGLYPGVAEEALEALKAERPLYVVGGFGGAARSIYEAITDPVAHGQEELLRACQKSTLSCTPGALEAHRRWIKQLDKPELRFDPKGMIKTFKKIGANGLSKLNGLSRAENERLAVSQEVYEILELLVKGLVRCQSAKTSRRS